MKTTAFTTAFCLLAISAIFTPATEAAQAPDFARYCKTFHPGSFVNSFRTNNKPICTKRTSNLSLLHHRINVGEACRLTTGSTSYRRTGRGKYSCLGKKQTARTIKQLPRGIVKKIPKGVVTRRPTIAARSVLPNYRKYCQTYHRGSFVNTLRATQEKICTTRTDRYRMVHNRIDLAKACLLTINTRRYRRYGPGVVRCLR